MKSLVLVSVFVICFSFSADAQIISAKSNKLPFNSNKTDLVISGISDRLSFDSSTPTIISSKSELSFDLNQSNSAASQQKVIAQKDELDKGVANAEVKSEIENKLVVTQAQTKLPNEGEVLKIDTTPQESISETIRPNPVNIPSSSDTTRSAGLALESSNPIKKSIGKELGEEYESNLPKYKALIFGVSEYKFAGPGLPSLENPTKDAQSLYDVLTQEYTFSPEDVKFIVNPTRREIIDALELVSAEITSKDNLLVFYAGHGYYDKTKDFGYWLPSDAKASSRVDWIPNSTIKDYLSAIKSKHTLLISDACFAGSIFKTRAVDAYTILKINEVYRNPSRKAITSGSLTVVPDKSIFLEYLLKKLRDNKDDYLPSQKLFSRIYEPIYNNSPAVPQFGVVQGTGDEGGDFVFIKRPK